MGRISSGGPPWPSLCGPDSAPSKFSNRAIHTDSWIDPVVLGMCPDEFDQDTPIRVGNVHQEAVLVAPGIEDGAIVRHEIDTAAELCLKVGGTDPNGL